MSVGSSSLTREISPNSIHHTRAAHLPLNLYPSNCSPSLPNSAHPHHILSNKPISTMHKSIATEEDLPVDSTHINKSELPHPPPQIISSTANSTRSSPTRSSSGIGTAGPSKNNERSNSLPIKSMAAASRRAIFPTLYESKSQRSPLHKNQKRKDKSVQASTSSASAIADRASAISDRSSAQLPTWTKFEVKVARKDKHTDVKEGCTRFNAKSKHWSTTSSSTEDHHDNLLTSSELKKSLSKSFSMENPPTACPASLECVVGTGMSTVSATAAGQSKKSNNTKKEHKSQTALSKTRTTIIASDDSATFNDHESDLISNQSPNSIAYDIHKRIQPGPSILRRKILPNLATTPLPGAQVPLILPRDGSTINRNSDQSNIVASQRHEASPIQETSSLHETVSDSSIREIENISLRDENDKCNSSRRSLLPSRPGCIALEHVHNEESMHQTCFTRHISHEEMKKPCKKRIRFDPRVWVHEIEKIPVEKTWYNDSDMKRFKIEAALRIKEWAMKRQRSWSTGMIATGTGRIITRNRPPPRGGSKAFYTNPALRMDADDEDESHEERIDQKREEHLLKEIKTVLLVDCHDIFLSLLTKDIKAMMPHVKVSTAYTVDDALDKINDAKKITNLSHGFDIIVVENRLRTTSRRPIKTKTGSVMLSGANLIQRIAFDTQHVTNCTQYSQQSHPLIIGMSAYLDQDGKKLRDCGSDIVWSKPPPKMDTALKHALLIATMKKRRRRNLSELFQDTV